MRIKIVNVRHGDVFPHRIILVRGIVLVDGSPSPDPTEATVIGSDIRATVTSDGRRKVFGNQVRGNHFKILVALVAVGWNSISVECRYGTRPSTAFVEVICQPPQNSPARFKLIYVTYKDHERAKRCCPYVDLESAKNRIVVAATLIQCFLSECVFVAGFPRRTLFLDLEKSSLDPICHVLESDLDMGEAVSMSDDQLWKVHAREVLQEFPPSDCPEISWKYLCITSATRSCKMRETISQCASRQSGIARFLALLGVVFARTANQSQPVRLPWVAGVSPSLELARSSNGLSRSTQCKISSDKTLR